MRWTSAIGLAALALAGCGQASEDELVNGTADSQPGKAGLAPNESVEQPQPAEPGEIGNQADGGEEKGGAGTSLPPPDGLRFVGLWASNAANCEGQAWEFTANRLETPAGSVCIYSKVTPVPGGYDIAATCTAEAPPTEDMLELRFAESARAMLFESDSIADAGLVYCGRG